MGDTNEYEILQIVCRGASQPDFFTLFTGVVGIIGAFFGIVGVIFAIQKYYKWREDFNMQKSHEYALSILKQAKILHSNLEAMRASRFYNRDDLEGEH